MLSMVRYQGAQAQLRAPRSTFTAAMSAFGFVFLAPDIAGRVPAAGVCPESKERQEQGQGSLSRHWYIGIHKTMLRKCFLIAVAMHWSTATAFVNTKVLPRCTARTVAGEHTLSCSAVAPARSRRSVLVGAVAAQLLCSPLAATAFDNRVVPKGKFPPTPGPKPKGVGDGPKDGQLKFCTGQPNCFTSSPLEEDAEHFYPPFEYTGMSKSDAMDTLLEVITNYKPGQGKIDEGGFKVRGASL